jgi:predicted Zn finger-like uncharacterized protein
MNLNCPSCASVFRIEPEQLGTAGRKVRCGDCGHTWFQAPGEAVEAAAPARAPEPEPAAPEPEPAAEAPEPVAEAPDAGPPAAARAAEPPPPEEEPRARVREEAERMLRRTAPRPPSRQRRRGGSLAAGWLLLLLLVGGVTAGLYLGRDAVLARYPAAVRLYALAGLANDRPGVGLELREVKSVRRMIGGERVVVIEGLVANVSEQTRDVPLLRASLTDASGVQLAEWTFNAGAATLPPGGTAGFETSTKNPPREGSLSIDFVTR